MMKKNLGIFLLAITLVLSSCTSLPEQTTSERPVVTDVRESLQTHETDQQLPEPETLSSDDIIADTVTEQSEVSKGPVQPEVIESLPESTVEQKSPDTESAVPDDSAAEPADKQPEAPEIQETGPVMDDTEIAIQRSPDTGETIPEEPVYPTLSDAVAGGDILQAEAFILADTQSVNEPDADSYTPLHIAAMNADEKMIKLLLKHGADPSIQDNTGRLPLHIAASYSFELAHLLTGKGELIFVKDDHGISPLDMAFNHGPKAVSSLLGEQFVNTTDSNGNTPVHYAAERGDYKTVDELIEYGADINMTNDAGELPLDIAFSHTTSSDHVQVAQSLIESYSVIPSSQEFYYAYQTIANGDVNMRFEGGTTPLHFAAEHDHPALMQMFIASNAYLEARDEQGDTPLHIAVSHNYFDIVEILVSSGANIDARDALNNTPLHLAVSSGRDTTTARYLLEQGAQVDTRNTFGDTPLTNAMYKDVDSDFVRLLLSNGADPNNRNRTGNTPIMTALTQDNRTACELLLDHGADIYAQNYNGITPLIRAMIKGIDTFSWFYRAEMNDTTDGEGNTPLHTAVMIGASLEVIEHIIKTAADLDSKNLMGETPLHMAVTFGYPEAASLLTASGADPFIDNNRGKPPVVLAFEKGIEFTSSIIQEHNLQNSDQEGNTPLHLAAKWDFSDISDYLIKLGASVNARNDQGLTPLHMAVKNNSISICQLLANNGAIIDSRDNYGNTPLHTAISWGSSKAAKFLLLLGANVELRNLSGNTPLHTAVLHRDQMGIKMLFEYGASLEARDNTGMTPLLLSTRKNYWEISELLIELGADYNTRDDRGNTPLHEAVRNKNQVTCGLLSEKGADIYAENRYGDTPLSIAFKAGNEVVDWFITGSIIYDRDDQGNTPLHTAIEQNASAEVIQTLIDKGADINSRNNKINTPLHNAFLANNKTAVEVLVNAGADLFSRNGDGATPLTMAFSMGVDTLSWIIHPGNMAATDQYGNTPLHAAAAFGSEDSVDYLLAIGADPNIKNLAGETPADLAEKAGHPDIANRLRILEL